MPHVIYVSARSRGEAPTVAGRPPRAANEMALNAGLARQLGVGVGDTVLVEDHLHKDTSPPLRFTVTGLTALRQTYVPLSMTADGYPTFFIGSPYALVSTAALPAIIEGQTVAAIGTVYWNGAPELVTSILPDVTVKDGDGPLPHPWYHGNWWMALAVCLAAASVTWWALWHGGAGASDGATERSSSRSLPQPASSP